MAYYYGDGNYQKPHNNQNNSSGNGDWFPWVLIAIFFMTGLWPVGLILLISKLSDMGSKKKKPTSSSQRQTATQKKTVSQQTQTGQTQTGQTQTGQTQTSRTQTGQTTAAQPKRTTSGATAAKKNVVSNMMKTPQYSDKGSRIMQIIGWIVAGLGGFALLGGLGDAIGSGSLLQELGTIFFSTGMLAGGLGLLLGGWKMKRRARRFTKYLAAAGKKDSIDINRLAEAAEVSERKAERDLEIMVEKGLWGPEAYVDNTNDMLFRTHEAAAKYFDKKNPMRERFVSTPPQADEGFSGMLRNIRRANDRIADPTLSMKIDRLEEITSRIFKTIEDHPERRDKANTFLNYYLPTTQKLLDSYADFEEAGVSGANLTQAKARIERTMDNIVAGFEHQLDELYQAEAMDVDSDIRVMESMLRRDTSTVEDDFGLNGGTAVQEWEQE